MQDFLLFSFAFPPHEFQPVRSSAENAPARSRGSIAAGSGRKAKPL
jgi:hypothetical protein